MDPIEDLSNDHRQVLDLLEKVDNGSLPPDSEAVDEAVRLLSIHAAAEEMIVYPAVHDLVPTGENLSAQHLNEHQLVKDLLVAIERSSGDDRVALVASLTAYVRHHVRHEEEVLFPKLREHASDQQLSDIGDALAKAKSVAPTHPHPHAPNQPPAIFPAGAAAALIDRVRDAIASRKG